jgi:hypothetical protein
MNRVYRTKQGTENRARQQKIPHDQLPRTGLRATNGCQHNIAQTHLVCRRRAQYHVRAKPIALVFKCASRISQQSRYQIAERLV